MVVSVVRAVSVGRRWPPMAAVARVVSAVRVASPALTAVTAGPVVMAVPAAPLLWMLKPVLVAMAVSAEMAPPSVTAVRAGTVVPAEPVLLAWTGVIPVPAVAPGLRARRAAPVVRVASAVRSPVTVVTVVSAAWAVPAGPAGLVGPV